MPDDSGPARKASSAEAAGSLPSARPVATGPKRAARLLPEDARQLVRVSSASWPASEGSLSRHARTGPSAAWTQIGEPITVVLGRAGLGWGRGLHGSGPPAGSQGPLKREGDKRAPAGLFRVGRSFGYAASPPRGSQLPYTRSTSDWRCVDDVTSRHYNRLLDQSELPEAERDWNSAERLLRRDGRYAWLLVVEHNLPSPVAGGGSCIFLHVWHQQQPTIGCTAMAEQDLASLLRWLEPGAVYAAAPEAEMHRLLP